MAPMPLTTNNGNSGIITGPFVGLSYFACIDKGSVKRFWSAYVGDKLVEVSWLLCALDQGQSCSVFLGQLVVKGAVRVNKAAGCRAGL